MAKSPLDTVPRPSSGAIVVVVANAPTSVNRSPNAATSAPCSRLPCLLVLPPGPRNPSFLRFIPFPRWKVASTAVSIARLLLGNVASAPRLFSAAAKKRCTSAIPNTKTVSSCATLPIASSASPAREACVGTRITELASPSASACLGTASNDPLPLLLTHPLFLPPSLPLAHPPFRQPVLPLILPPTHPPFALRCLLRLLPVIITTNTIPSS